MKQIIQSQRILILDFGSQYTQLIARRVRELGVYCEIQPFDFSDDDIYQFAPQGIILSGGPESVMSTTSPRASESIFQLGCPLLGICYGMQTMALQLGGKVTQGIKREFGFARIIQDHHNPLLQDIMDDQGCLDVWMSHGDEVSELPPDFIRIAYSDNCNIVGMANEKAQFYGLQFHPEVSHTQYGLDILKRFLLTICACQPTWTTKNIIQESIENIRHKVGQDHVVLGLSGGVDSSVVAALLQKAIGSQLTSIFVDTGLLRLNEREEVQKLFADHLNIQLIIVHAEQRFLEALKHVDDPEKKRKIIGNLFIDIFQEEASQLPNVKWLAQGTIYPDVIESANHKNQTIKSHHNVGGLPEKMHLKLLEPLRELFKDEVRKIGIELGLPHQLVYRHPFPGPGLGVRILGQVKKEYADTLRLADAILLEELQKNDFYHKTSQAFAVFLPVKSVGVQGDARQYDHVISLRIVETHDFMTATIARLPLTFLENVANRIVNEVRGISRVVYDISGKPPATIEWE